jgi:hypothetical protein
MNNYPINHNKNFNCYFLTVRAILAKKVNFTNLFWNQSGMISYREDNRFTFTPYFKSLPEHLHNHFKIKEIIMHSSEFEHFYSQLCNVLKSDKTALLLSDVFDLPYTLYYRQKYNAHAVEILKADEKEILICDHYYKYSGTISKQKLEGIIKARIARSEAEDFYFLYYETEQHILPRLERYIALTIQNNTEYMKGNDPFIKGNFRTVKKIGLAAFDEFVHYIDEEVFTQRENIDISHECLKEYGNSRNNYSVLLEEYKHFDPVLGVIASEYLALSNSIQVTANMILKCFITQKFDQFRPRVLKKLQEIRNKEIALINLSDHISIARVGSKIGK